MKAKNEIFVFEIELVSQGVKVSQRHTDIFFSFSVHMNHKHTMAVLMNSNTSEMKRRIVVKMYTIHIQYWNMGASSVAAMLSIHRFGMVRCVCPCSCPSHTCFPDHLSMYACVRTECNCSAGWLAGLPKVNNIQLRKTTTDHCDDTSNAGTHQPHRCRPLSMPT